MSIKKWDSTEDWLEWIDTDGGEVRALSGGLLLPTLDSRPVSTISFTRVSRWRFANDQSLADSANSHDASIPADSPASNTELGLLFSTRNGHASVLSDVDFAYPDATNYMVMSCWFRSIITDYSDDLGIIAAYHVGTANGEIAYALVIDTDNKIKAQVRSGGTTTTISPSGGSVTVDTKWHHLALFMGTTATGRLQMVVDNDGTWAPVATVTQTVDSGTAQFSIGSSEFSGSTHLGVAGYIDELQVSEHLSTDFSIDNARKKYDSAIYLSTVFDTGQDENLLSSIFSEFEIPNDSSVTFSFRAQDASFSQDDTALAWTGFTSPNQITTGISEDLSNLGIFAKGRYQQVRAKLVPSTSNSSIVDALQTDTPTLKRLEINTAPSPVLINVANAAHEPGTVLGQIVEFSGSKEIHKASLNLSVSSVDRRTSFVGKGGAVSFAAANFQSGRDTWAFQPVLHWTNSNGWTTSGTTIQNTLQAEAYTDANDAVLNAPCLKYKLIFDVAGVYDIWGFGYVDGAGSFWSFDDDATH